MRALILSLVPLAAGAMAPPSDGLEVAWDGLRSQKGRMLICVTRHREHFPDCSADPDKLHYDVTAQAGGASLGVLPPGDYAIAIVHDENGNGRLDTFMGLPREGVGFSRNPAIRFGPPGFRAASFAIVAGPARQTIRLKYFL